MSYGPPEAGKTQSIDEVLEKLRVKDGFKITWDEFDLTEEEAKINKLLEEVSSKISRDDLIKAVIEVSKESIQGVEQANSYSEGTPGPYPEENTDSVDVPKYAELLLSIVLPATTREDTLGDLEERFCKILKKCGPKSANLFYWSRMTLEVGTYVGKGLGKITGLGFVMALVGWLKNRISWTE